MPEALNGAVLGPAQARPGRLALRKHPEVAAQILDPASATVSETVRPATVRGITCKSYNRYIAYSTLTGAKAFDWHHEIYICPKGAKGVHRVSRRQYVANRDPNFYLRTADSARAPRPRHFTTPRRSNAATPPIRTGW
ncbi:hypothetical protein ABZ442_20770 [Streptomyces triculaminicus]|uniref:hypothetical protein n=1 Tax=Streptomyces triculaminicus TaxID=2816232 RepID=UPI0033EB8533